MNQLQQTTEHLKVLAHPLRLLIIRALRRNHHLSVGQLAGLCEASPPLISGHLRLLKDRGLLRKQRQGRQVFYHVSEPALARIVDCFGLEAD
jgi:DNA-binding transcriptional ArsR family regulator